VRFFERIKLERGIKKLEKQLAQAREKGQEAPAAQLERLACLQDDLQVYKSFPLSLETAHVFTVLSVLQPL
jgi:hypothetical protein